VNPVAHRERGRDLLGLSKGRQQWEGEGAPPGFDTTSEDAVPGSASQHLADPPPAHSARRPLPQYATEFTDFLTPPPLRGRLGGGARAERIKNHAQHPIGIRKHVVVPEADDTITTSLEPARAHLTVIGMLPAIDLDDELRLGAEEIDDVGSERVLAAEAETFELFAPQA
jgi:hypothetical protein